jgi:hypothetical protein
MLHNYAEDNVNRLKVNMKFIPDIFLCALSSHKNICGCNFVYNVLFCEDFCSR